MRIPQLDGGAEVFTPEAEHAEAHYCQISYGKRHMRVDWQEHIVSTADVLRNHASRAHAFP